MLFHELTPAQKQIVKSAQEMLKGFGIAWKNFPDITAQNLRFQDGKPIGGLFEISWTNHDKSKTIQMEDVEVEWDGANDTFMVVACRRGITLLC